jgi:hypothetical protein
MWKETEVDNIMDKIKVLSTGEKLIGGGAIVMFIASFLPWYKVSFDIGEISGSISRNGWESPGAIWSVLAVLLALALAGSIVAAKLGNMRLPDLGSGLTWGIVYLGGGGLVALFILIKLINESSSLSFGFFIGIVAAVAIAAGGYLLYSEEKAGSS